MISRRSCATSDIFPIYVVRGESKQGTVTSAKMDPFDWIRGTYVRHGTGLKVMPLREQICRRALILACSWFPIK